MSTAIEKSSKTEQQVLVEFWGPENRTGMTAKNDQLLEPYQAVAYKINN